MGSINNIVPSRSTGKLIQNFIGQYAAVVDLPDANNYVDGTVAYVQGVGWRKVDSGSWVGTSPTEAAVILAELLTVDGAGSGLDADTLDGQEASDVVLQSEVGVANGVAELDGAGDVPQAQIPDLSSLYALLSGATFTGNVYSDDGSAFIEQAVKRSDQSAVGQNDKVSMHVRTGSGAARFLHYNLDTAAVSVALDLTRSGLVTIDGNPIVDSGSNTNGSWVRYYDGTQICWREYTLADPVQTLANGVYLGSSQTWTFPASFTGNPAVSGSLGRVGGEWWGAQVAWDDQSTTTSVTYRMMLWEASSGDHNAYVRLIASGRWY